MKKIYKFLFVIGIMVLSSTIFTINSFANSKNVWHKGIPKILKNTYWSSKITHFSKNSSSYNVFSFKHQISDSLDVAKSIMNNHVYYQFDNGVVFGNKNYYKNLSKNSFLLKTKVQAYGVNGFTYKIEMPNKNHLYLINSGYKTMYHRLNKTSFYHYAHPKNHKL